MATSWPDFPHGNHRKFLVGRGNPRMQGLHRREMTSVRIAPNLSVASVESIEVAPRRQSELAAEPDPLAFSVARVLLVAALIGAPLAFGAVITGAWIALGLVASLSLFLWATGSVWQRRLDLVWSPLYIPVAAFLLLGLTQYWAQL